MKLAKVRIVLIAIGLLFLPSLCTNILAQGQFLIYENSDYDISIQYPNDWTPSEDNLLPHQVVIFSAPEIEEEESSVSTIIYIPADLAIAVQPLYSPDMTIDQFIDRFLNETYASPTEYRIIESSNATLAGVKEAKEIVMYEYVGDTTSKVMRTIGIENGTAYMIKYVAEPGQFSAYLPIAQRMIDSFRPSLQQQRQVGFSSNDVISNMTQSQNITEPSVRTETQIPPRSDIILQPKSTDTNVPQLPKTLMVTDDTVGDSRLPLRFSITNGVATDVTASGSTEGELYDWYPIAIFRFNEPSQIGLVNVRHILSGAIKSYESPEDILEDANYWENIPLNEQVVLEMNQPGLNYLIAAVQFANGTSGVYPAVMEVEASGSKSQGEDNLEFRMDEGEELNILDKSDIENIQEDPGFQQAASNIICAELNNYGFQVCQQPGITADAIEQPSPTRSADITSLFEEEEEDNGNEDDDDGENDDDDN